MGSAAFRLQVALDSGRFKEAGELWWSIRWRMDPQEQREVLGMISCGARQKAEWWHWWWRNERWWRWNGWVPLPEGLDPPLPF